MSVQADLEKLAIDINKLKVEHDMFFVGAIPTLPHQLKKKVEETLKKYRNSQKLTFAQRFHFNTLLSRYNAFNELWTKMLRELEMTGKSPIFRGARAAEANGANGDKIIAKDVLKGTRKDLDIIKKLHSEYEEARKAAGNGQNGVPFKSFISQLVRQAKSIREKTKCTDIEVKVYIKDDKVIIKAKGI
jgi:hypothetical protein